MKTLGFLEAPELTVSVFGSEGTQRVTDCSLHKIAVDPNFPTDGHPVPETPFLTDLGPYMVGFHSPSCGGGPVNSAGAALPHFLSFTPFSRIYEAPTGCRVHKVHRVCGQGAAVAAAPTFRSLQSRC